MTSDEYPLTPFLDLASEEDVKPFFASARAQRSAKEERSPNVGDVVHFKASGTACWAAIVTGVDDFSDNASLAMFPPGDTVTRVALDISHDESQRGMATWHWGHE